MEPQLPKQTQLSDGTPLPSFLNSPTNVSEDTVVESSTKPTLSYLDSVLAEMGLSRDDLEFFQKEAIWHYGGAMLYWLVFIGSLSAGTITALEAVQPDLHFALENTDPSSIFITACCAVLAGISGILQMQESSAFLENYGIVAEVYIAAAQQFVAAKREKLRSLLQISDATTS